MKPEVEQYVLEFGEPYRQLIQDSLEWLEQREPDWNLSEPIDRREFLKLLIERAKPIQRE